MNLVRADNKINSQREVLISIYLYDQIVNSN